MTKEKITFNELPGSAEDLKSYDLTSPFRTAALAIAALTKYESDKDTCFAMLDYLKGPDNVSPFEKQFIRDRLAGKQYKVNSFFLGSSPENGYTPAKPYAIEVSDNPYSYPQADRATLYVQSSGADSPRPITLRKKPSTGQWFLVEIQCLADIRVPVADDPWA